MAGSESDDKPKPSQAAVSETTAANQQHDAAPHNTEQTAEPTDSKRTKSIPQDDSAKSVPSSPESDDAGHPPTKHDRGRFRLTASRSATIDSLVCFSPAYIHHRRSHKQEERSRRQRRAIFYSRSISQAHCSTLFRCPASQKEPHHRHIRR